MRYFVITLFISFAPLLLSPAQAQQAPAHCEKDGEMLFTKECINALLSNRDSASVTDSSDNPAAGEAASQVTTVKDKATTANQETAAQTSGSTAGSTTSSANQDAASTAAMVPAATDSTSNQASPTTAPDDRQEPTEVTTSSAAPTAGTEIRGLLPVAPVSPLAENTPAIPKAPPPQQAQPQIESGSASVDDQSATTTNESDLSQTGDYATCSPDGYLAAARHNELDSMRHCAEQQRLINAQESGRVFRGRTPLHWAIINDNLMMLRHLLATPAVQQQRSLVDHGGYPIHLAAARGMNQGVEMLLQRGADPSSRNLLQQTPLHHAAGQGHLDTVQMLLEKGASLQVTDRIGKTVLMSAVASDNPELVRFLLARKPDINSSTLHGTTALHYAALNSAEITNMLLDAGARPDPVTLGGYTPLTLLLSTSPDHYQDTIRLFIDRGANIDHINGQGRRPIDISLEEGRLRLFKQLLKQGADTTHLRLSQLQDRPDFLQALQQLGRL